MVSRYKNKILILHDFNLDLKLYKISNFIKKKILKQFKNKIKFISTDEKVDESNYDKIQIFWGNRLNIQLLKKLKNLKWIHFGSSGIDYKLKKEILDRKINITRSNKILSKPVVASIIFKIFFLGRGMMPIINNKYYDRKNFEKNFDDTTSVFGERVLIFGKGEISKLLKKKLNSINIDANIVNLRSKEKIIKNKSIINKITKSKFIINCLPLNEKTINFFDKKIFIFFKKNYFINVGRGETVNNKDLIYFLKNKMILAASLDVFNKKDYVSPYRPLRYNSTLWKNNKILLTPHISARSNNYWDAQIKLFSNLLRKKIKTLGS